MTDETIYTLSAEAISGFLKNPAQWQASLTGTNAVYQLEQKFCRLLRKPYALTFSSATAAIFAILKSLGLEDRDVLCPPLTWGGSIAGLLATGNRPLWVDVLPGGTVDPAQIEDAITPTTRALLAVDLYGNPASQTLRHVANKHGLFYLQDCAQSFGAYVGSRHTGHLADAAIFSLGFNKPLFGGEGAVAILQDQWLYERLIEQFHHPTRQRRDQPFKPANEFALNLRINPFAAVLANAVGHQVLAEVDRHREVCLRLLQRLNSEGLSATPVPPTSIKPAFYTFAVEPAVQSEDLAAWLAREAPEWRIAPLPIREPLYQHEYYRRLAARKGWSISRCPAAEAHCRTRVALTKAS
jgi:dTDP-4-amino-4,6-dideoxygalactose transaminase